MRPTLEQIERSGLRVRTQVSPRGIRIVAVDPRTRQTFVSRSAARDTRAAISALADLINSVLTRK